MTEDVAIGIDLGGTNLAVALVSADGVIHMSQRAATASIGGPRDVIRRVADMVADMLASLSITRDRVIGAGIGAPGPLSLADGRVIRTANLPEWEDAALRDDLSRALDMPAILDNDGNAAAYGEHWMGAGRGQENLVMLTLGTGIGAGVVINGELLHGHFDSAAELGHMIVDVNGRPCPCGQRGCLEQYASASAVVRRVREAMESCDQPPAQTPTPSTSPINAAPIDAADVARRAIEGDPTCLRVWDDACRFLAVACVNIQHAYNPSLVVFGGGMALAGAFLIDRVSRYFSSMTWTLHADQPLLALSSLGNDAGVIGAAGLVWHSRETSCADTP